MHVSVGYVLSVHPSIAIKPSTIMRTESMFVKKISMSTQPTEDKNGAVLSVYNIEYI